MASTNVENTAKSGRKASKRRYCCVKDCHNREGLPGIQFYRFPGRPWEEQRRKKWILAVRRVNQSDGSEWTPNSSARICSSHFVNGRKSNIATHPSYNPTVFPDVYKVRLSIGSDNLERFKRWQKNTSDRSFDQHQPNDTDGVKEGENSSSSSDAPVAYELEPAADAQKAQDQACQTEGVEATSTMFSVFICLSQGTEASTQVSHGTFTDAEVQCGPTTTSRHSGPDHRTSSFNGYDSVSSCDATMRDLCGVSLEVFALLLSILPTPLERPYVSMCDRLVMFLMKLKLGISYSSIAVLFSVHRKTVARHFHSILRTLSTATQRWIFRPPSHVTLSTMPDCFKVHYPDCTIIIDCTEVRSEKPSTVQQQRVLYSHYKGGYTLKFLVGITPCGTICFRSKSYGGRCSDAFVTVDSGFLDLVHPGDVVLADKGFPGIKAGLEGVQVALVMPPFLQGHGQFTETEVAETYHIAQVRIHVERMIQRIKIYNILNSRIPTELISEMSDVFHMCCILANLQTPIIKDKELVDS